RANTLLRAGARAGCNAPPRSDSDADRAGRTRYRAARWRQSTGTPGASWHSCCGRRPRDNGAFAPLSEGFGLLTMQPHDHGIARLAIAAESVERARRAFERHQ